MTFYDILNLIGYVFMITAYMPQFIQLYRKKKSDQLSILWPLVIVTGCLFMEPLAITGGLLAYAIGNTASIIVSLLLLCQILWYRKK